MTGFLTPDYTDRYADARTELARWMREGRLVAREHVLEGGVRAFPDALLQLFAGANAGKLILAIAHGAGRGG
jgi:NADPH-dependent curcumin reductase CurA